MHKTLIKLLVLYCALLSLVGLAAYKLCNTESITIIDETSLNSESDLSIKNAIVAVQRKDTSSGVSAEYLNATLVNADTVGWLICDDLGIDEPVVQGVDNKEYLRTNFEGVHDLQGSIFLDSRCNLEVAPLLKMLHGHNMKDGTMFANLPKLLTLEETAQAPLFQFYTPSAGLVYYKVISVYSVSSKEEALPLDVLYSVDELEELKNQLIAKSDVKVTTSEALDGIDLLLLNTCWYGESGNERNLHCVVVLVRE